MIDQLGVTIVDNSPPPSQFDLDLIGFKKDIAAAIDKNDKARYIGVSSNIVAEFLGTNFRTLCQLNADVHFQTENLIT